MPEGVNVSAYLSTGRHRLALFAFSYAGALPYGMVNMRH